MNCTPLMSLIPSIQPKWKRTATRAANTFEPSSSSRQCEVCEQQVSRYTCPKCSAAYCSLDCYKQHGGTCTEAFYQEKVTQVLELERKNERSRGIHEILNRVHQEEQDCEFANELTMLELERIREALKSGDVQVDLSPELKAAFERDIQAGRLNHCVQPWSPWWTGDIVCVVDEEHVLTGLTLDERLLQIPPFSNLCSKEAPSSLKFNLVSILISICQTLRLYGGRENAQMCEEAAETLTVTSPVLSKDERFASLEEVLMAHNRCHLEDIVCILGNQRHIAHALFDGIDILKSTTAIKTTAKNSLRKKYKTLRKKLEFYLSWSRGVNIESLSRQVLSWQDEWKLKGEIQTLKLS